MPPAERNRLFTQGARLTPRPTGGEESRGFGLRVVRQLIEFLDGAIGADFPPDGGGVFWFELPAA